MGTNPSGRFVLRLPSELHGALRTLAMRKGLSLNELCLRAIKNYVTGMETDEENGARAHQKWFMVIQDILAESLLGVVLFGSKARGEDHIASDIDLLIVVATDLPLTRRLYALWDEHLSGEQYSPHFVHLPEDVDELKDD